MALISKDVFTLSVREMRELYCRLSDIVIDELPRTFIARFGGFGRALHDGLSQLRLKGHRQRAGLSGASHASVQAERSWRASFPELAKLLLAGIADDTVVNANGSPFGTTAGDI